MEDSDQRKSEAIQRLMSLELDFIDFMTLGIRRYLRPLRHRIFSVAQHNAVFQNVEKVSYKKFSILLLSKDTWFSVGKFWGI